MNKRTKELMKLAALALKNGTDPFGDFFLSENKVTAEEAFDLAETMAEMIDAFVGA
jgi:hypothetical protein